MSPTCPICEEVLGLEEEWRLRPEVEPGKLETEYDHDFDEVYMHEDCWERYTAQEGDSA